MNPQERALLDACKKSPAYVISALVCAVLWVFCLYDPFTLEDNIRTSLFMTSTVGGLVFLAQIAYATEQTQQKGK